MGFPRQENLSGLPFPPPGFFSLVVKKCDHWNMSASLQTENNQTFLASDWLEVECYSIILNILLVMKIIGL